MNKLTKEEVIEISEKYQTIPIFKLKMDSNIGRVPTDKSKEWISTYFERSKFELLNYHLSKSEMIDYIKSLGVLYNLDYKVLNSECDIFVPEYNVGFKMISLLYHGEI